MHAYTHYSSIIPFGATMMKGTWGNENGAELMMMETSGVEYGYCGYCGCASGKIKSVAKTELDNSLT